MVELFLDEMAIKTKDEVKITKKLRTKGISLVEEDLKLFFLVPEKLQTVWTCSKIAEKLGLSNLWKWHNRDYYDTMLINHKR